MKILVALWSRNVTARLNTDNNYKVVWITTAVQWLAGYMTSLNLPVQDWYAPFPCMFILPEYYFSRQRPDPAGYKAMGEEAKDIAVAHLLRLSAAYPGCLLIPGTFAFRKSLVRPQFKSHRQSVYARAFGTAVGEAKAVPRTIKAGANLQSNPDTVTLNQPYLGIPATTESPAQKLAHMDHLIRHRGEANTFIYKNSAYVIHGGRIVFKYNKKRDFFETFGAVDQIHAPDVSKSAMATLGGIRFGFEICFDHNLGSLTGDVNANAQASAQCLAAGLEFFSSPPQIHVVVSDAVPNNPLHTPIGVGGFYIHACTANASTTLQVRTPGGLTGVCPRIITVLPPVPMDGDPLRLFLIDVRHLALSGYPFLWQ